MRSRLLLLVIGGLALAVIMSREVYAQKQLVLLKGQKVLLRLYPGDEVVFKMRGGESKIASYVNNLYDTALLAHQTVIPFSKIEKVYFVRSSFMNKVGGALVVGGAGYFIIDQLNTIIVQGEGASLDENVTRASVAMVATGLPMMLIKKRSQRVKRGYRLLTVQPGSPFYKRTPDHMGY